MGLYKNIKMQLYLLLTKKSFLFSFLFFLLLNCYCFYMEMKGFKNKDIYYIISADLAYSLNINTFGYIIVPIAAILCAIPFSDSYLADKENNILPTLFSKTTKIDYLLSKCIVTFIGTFLLFFIPLFINQSICLTFFPVISNIKHHTLSPTLSVNLYNAINKYFCNRLYLFNPYLYNIFYTFLFSVFFSILSCFAFSVSIFLKSYRMIILALPYAIFLLFQSMAYICGDKYLNLVNIITPQSYGLSSTSFLLILFVVFEIIFILVTLITKSKTEN